MVATGDVYLTRSLGQFCLDVLRAVVVNSAATTEGRHTHRESSCQSQHWSGSGGGGTDSAVQTVKLAAAAAAFAAVCAASTEAKI